MKPPLLAWGREMADGVVHAAVDLHGGFAVAGEVVFHDDF
jgi:hypothetical protein